MKNASGTKQYIYDLDGDELEKIYAPDGIIFSFKPSTGTPTHLQISTESGDFQFSIPITSISYTAGDNAAGIIPLTTSDESKSVGAGITAASTSQNTYYLRVLQCGDPVEDALSKRQPNSVLLEKTHSTKKNRSRHCSPLRFFF